MLGKGATGGPTGLPKALFRANNRDRTTIEDDHLATPIARNARNRNTCEKLVVGAASLLAVPRWRARQGLARVPLARRIYSRDRIYFLARVYARQEIKSCANKSGRVPDFETARKEGHHSERFLADPTGSARMARLGGQEPQSLSEYAVSAVF